MCRKGLTPGVTTVSGAAAEVASSELLNSLAVALLLEKPGASGKESRVMVVVGESGGD